MPTTPPLPPLRRAAALAALPGVVHGVTTRDGGVSTGPYATLNLGLHVGDEPAAVVENRRRVAVALGLGADDLVYAAQVHGALVVPVGAPDRGRGARDHAAAIPSADGLVTAEPGVGLVVLAADCVPILLADPIRRAVGAVHAGWRGLAADAPGAAVAALAALGSDPADLVAAVGPCIGPEDYPVGSDVAAAMAERHGAAAAAWFSTSPEGAAMRLDLARAARDQLVAAGIPAGRIDRVDGSTATDPRCFSHRASGGRTGRLAAVIALR